MRNKSNYVKTEGPIKMILVHVAEIVNASMVSKFHDNQPKENGVKGDNGALICGNTRKMYNYAKTGGLINMISGGVAEILNASLVLEFDDNRPREGERVGGVKLWEFRKNP